MSENSTANTVSQMPKVTEYDALGVVTMSLGGRSYQVRFNDGAELIATNSSEESVSDGTGVGLIAADGVWTMYVLG